MKQWTSAQRIVFLVALGWVAFSFFSPFFIKMYQEYIQDPMAYEDLNFSYTFAVIGAIHTSIALLLPLFTMNPKSPSDIGVAKWLIGYLIVIPVIGMLIDSPPGIGQGITILINALFVLMLILSFWPRKDNPLSTP